MGEFCSFSKNDNRLIDIIGAAVIIVILDCELTRDAKSVYQKRKKNPSNAK